MGSPMARNLLKNGYPIIATDLFPESCKELQDIGAQVRLIQQRSTGYVHSESETDNISMAEPLSRVCSPSEGLYAHEMLDYSQVMICSTVSFR